MKKNFVKKLALGLALVVTAGSVNVPAASAAATPDFKSSKATVNVGQTKKYNTENASKYSVKFKIGNKEVATIKYSKGSKAVKVTGVAEGTTTLRADFTSYKTKKVTTKKIKVTVKPITVSITGENNFATAVNEKYALTGKLSGKTSAKVYWSVAEENASIDENGVFTATKAGEYTVTATVKTSDGDVIATASQKVTVKTVVLNSVAQTKADTLKAVFTGDTSKIKREDVIVTNTATKAVLPVKSVAPSKTNPGEVTITTFAGMTDGNEYTVTYDGVSANFIATDGKVVGLGIAPAVITKGTETVIYGQLLDVNGVVVNEFKYLEQPANVDFNITTSNGYTTTDSKLYLNEIGNTATAKLTFHTYKWDEQGNEVGKIEKEFTITAVADATVVDDFRYTISSSSTAPNWSNLASTNSKITVEERNQFVHFKFVDSNGVNVTNKYSVESSDTSKLLISDSLANGSSAPIIAVDEGSAYILVKNSDGQVVKYLPVTVVAARKGTRLSVNPSTVILSDKNIGSDTVSATVTMYDQYGDKRNISSRTIKTVSKPTSATDPISGVTSTIGSNGKLTITFDGNSTHGWTDGTYTFKVDAAGADRNTVSQIITVTYRTVVGTGNEYAVVLGGVEANNTVDVQVAEGTTEADYNDSGLGLTIKVVEKLNGAFVQNCGLVSVNVTNPVGATTVVTGAAISGNTATYGLTTEISDPTVSGGAIVVKGVMDGTYKVTIEYKDNANITKVATAYFTVTGVSAQAKPAVVYVHDGEVVNITGHTSVTSAVQDSVNVIKFIYGDTLITASDISVSANDVVINGNDAYVKYVTVNVPVSTSLKVQVKVALNKTFTFDPAIGRPGV